MSFFVYTIRNTGLTMECFCMLNQCMWWWSRPVWWAEWVGFVTQPCEIKATPFVSHQLSIGHDDVFVNTTVYEARCLWIFKYANAGRDSLTTHPDILINKLWGGNRKPSPKTSGLSIRNETHEQWVDPWSRRRWSEASSNNGNHEQQW